MLERTSACLEKSGRSLFKSSRGGLRSRRELHSAFWSHGAAEIRLPSWWLLLHQRPASNDLDSTVDGTDSCLRYGIKETGFLDFLYPKKTLLFLHRLTHRDVTRFHTYQRHAVPPTRRSYSSEATGEGPLVGHESDRSANPIRRLEANKERRDTSSDARELLRNQRIDFEKESSRSLENFDANMNVNGRPSREYLTLLEKLEARGSQILRKHCEQVLQLLNTREIKSGWKSQDYAIAMKAHSLRNEPEQAMAMYQLSLDKFEDHATTQIILPLALNQRQWLLAVEAWDAFANKALQAEKYIWEGIMKMGVSKLWQRAIELADFTRSANFKVDVYLRDFTIRLIEHSFSLRDIENIDVSAFDHYRLFMMLKLLVARPTKQQYSSAIEQCLSLRFSGANIGAKSFGANAIRLYMSMRKRDDLRIQQPLLENILKRAVQIHNIDTEVIMQDLKNQAETINIRLWRLMLKHHLWKKSGTQFYATLEEAQAQHPNVLTSSLALQALRMHAQLKQVSKAIELFLALKEKTGEDPDIYHWSAIVLAYAWVGDTQGAKEWIKRMERHGINPDMHTYLPLINFHARRGDIEAVEHLTRDLWENGVPVHVAVLQKLIHAHLENEDLDRARELLFDSTSMNLKGDRVHMWNLVLGYFATRRSLVEINEIRVRMDKSNVEANSTTYASLASALCANRLPNSAWKLVRGMKKKPFDISAYHMSIVMAGYLRTRQYERVFGLYKYMVKNGILPDYGSNALLVKAAAMLDDKEGLAEPLDQVWPGLRRAEEIFEQLTGSDTFFETSRKRPLKGISWDSSTQDLISGHFDILIYIYGRREMFEKVDEIYSRYIKFASAHIEAGFEHDQRRPLKMLTALMNFHRNAGNYEEVERLWKYALEKTLPLVAPENNGVAKDRQRVLNSRRFILSIPLYHYMNTLVSLDRVDEFDNLFSQLNDMGYGIDNKAWNLYVQQMALMGDAVKSFETTEQYLISGWKGWPSSHHPAKIRDVVRAMEPMPHETWKQAPSYRTLVTLAKSLLEMQAKSPPRMGDFEQTFDMRHLKATTPRTLAAVRQLPRLDDRVQQELLI